MWHLQPIHLSVRGGLSFTQISNMHWHLPVSCLTLSLWGAKVENFLVVGMAALSKMALEHALYPQYNIVKELPVSWRTVLPVFKMCVGCLTQASQRWGLLWKMFSFLSLSYQTSCACCWFARTLDFLWHHHAVWNASCSQDAHTQVPTRGSPRLMSQVACLVLLWQHPRAHICQDVRRLRGSPCIHFISLTQAVWDYYLAVYKWSAILTATIAFSRRLQLQQGIQLQYNEQHLVYWLFNATNSFK